MSGALFSMLVKLLSWIRDFDIPMHIVTYQEGDLLQNFSILFALLLRSIVPRLTNVAFEYVFWKHKAFTKVLHN